MHLAGRILAAVFGRIVTGLIVFFGIAFIIYAVALRNPSICGFPTPTEGPAGR